MSGYILRQVCAGFAALPGGGGMRLGVNVVARHLLIPTFAELVLSTLQDTGLSPGRLTLEIVETA